MSSTSHKTKSELAATLLELFESCPFDHRNPKDCPLFPLRKLKPSERLAWLNALNEDDLSYLASYHYICLATKAGPPPAS